MHVRVRERDLVNRRADAICMREVNKFLENLSEGTRNVMSYYFLISSISQLITVKF